MASMGLHSENLPSTLKSLSHCTWAHLSSTLPSCHKMPQEIDDTVSFAASRRGFPTTAVCMCPLLHWLPVWQEYEDRKVSPCRKPPGHTDGGSRRHGFASQRSKCYQARQELEKMFRNQGEIKRKKQENKGSLPCVWEIWVSVHIVIKMGSVTMCTQLKGLAFWAQMLHKSCFINTMHYAAS